MNKTISILIALLITAVAGRSAGEGNAQRAANTVILDETGVRNLGIETVPVMETDFEDTLFALGRIEVIPSRRGIVSSRIAGRIVSINAFEGDSVAKDQVIVRVESRQPGNPPPTVDLKSPMDGFVVSAHASLGDPVGPDSHILEIIDMREAYAVARVPEDQAGRLVPGVTEARIRIAALPGESYRGKLLRFGTSADRESGTIDAIFQLKDLSDNVRPAMRAEFSIVIDHRENVMAVPRESLQGDSANRFVFVKDFELANAFVKAPVQTGEKNDRYVEILNGLFPGDEVVTKGAYPLVFAGGGGISLKEALDAAHGHEHAEDGSELTAAQKAQRAAEARAAAGGGTGGAGAGPLTIFLGILCTLLALLLGLSVMRGRARRVST